MLWLIARGYAYREIGRQLFISVKTCGDPRLRGAAQAAAVQPPPAHALGQRPAADLTGGLYPRPPTAQALGDRVDV